MSAVFPYSNTPKAFDGLMLLSVDGGATVWAFPNASGTISDSDNISRPDVNDNSSLSHIEVPGLRMGSLAFVAPLMPDRLAGDFAAAAFGPRTNQQLVPFIYNIIPYGGGAVIKGTGVWFSRVTISGSFGTSGQQAMNVIRAQAMVTDVDNVFAAPTLAIPTAAGKNGLGVSSFDNSSFSNGLAGGSLITYDKIRSYSFTLDNQLSVIPGVVDPVNRIGAGCQPGTLRGALTLEQLANPANPLPAVRGHYTIGLLLPTGDGSKLLTFLVSVSRDGSSISLVPTDFVGKGQLYSVFGTSTVTAGWLFATTYA